MNKKYKNIMVIIASVFSAIVGGRVVDNYGWIAGILVAVFIGAVVGIVGRIVIKVKSNSNQERRLSSLK